MRKKEYKVPGGPHDALAQLKGVINRIAQGKVLENKPHAKYLLNCLSEEFLKYDSKVKDLESALEEVKRQLPNPEANPRNEPHEIPE